MNSYGNLTISFKNCKKKKNPWVDLSEMLMSSYFCSSSSHPPDFSTFLKKKWLSFAEVVTLIVLLKLAYSQKVLFSVMNTTCKNLEIFFFSQQGRTQLEHLIALKRCRTWALPFYKDIQVLIKEGPFWAKLVSKRRCSNLCIKRFELHIM